MWVTLNAHLRWMPHTENRLYGLTLYNLISLIFDESQLMYVTRLKKETTLGGRNKRTEIIFEGPTRLDDNLERPSAKWYTNARILFGPFYAREQLQFVQNNQQETKGRADVPSSKASEKEEEDEDEDEDEDHNGGNKHKGGDDEGEYDDDDNDDDDDDNDDDDDDDKGGEGDQEDEEDKEEDDEGWQIEENQKYDPTRQGFMALADVWKVAAEEYSQSRPCNRFNHIISKDPVKRNKNKVIIRSENEATLASSVPGSLREASLSRTSIKRKSGEDEGSRAHK